MDALKCPACGSDVPPSKGKRPRKWCSKRCADRGSDLRTGRSAAYPASPSGLCKRCGDPVPPSNGTKPRSWCSDACRVRAWEEKSGRTSNWPKSAVSFPSCGICGTVFSARAGGRKHRSACSPGCEAELKRRKQREFSESMTDEQREKRRASQRRSNVKRRAAKAGATELESFDRVEIYERDGWVCGICRESVDRELAYPDLMSASLDHIVPLALGGSHTRDNVQCAHFICNATKGARPVAVSA